jgi:putative transcriptional regulator
VDRERQSRDDSPVYAEREPRPSPSGRLRDGRLFLVPRDRSSMADALEDKRTATRFRVLVEIADRQPAVSQGEVADAVGITSQAVSEYIRELDEEGYVEKQGRSRYQVTKEGVDWLFQEAKSLRRFADHVTEDVLETVEEDAAIATADVENGDTVTLSIRDGLLHATPGDEGPATGVATTDAAAGTDVSVTGFEGIIDIEPGSVTLFQLPPVRSGGSRAADTDALRDACESADLVIAAGVEAVVALRQAEVEPTVTVAGGEVAATAAPLGLDVIAVVTTETFGRVTDALRDADVPYEVADN